MEYEHMDIIGVIYGEVRFCVEGLFYYSTSS
jgi:hypothetical protein